MSHFFWYSFRSMAALSGSLVLGHSRIELVLLCGFRGWLEHKTLDGQELGCSETACRRQGPCPEETALIGLYQSCPTIRAAVPLRRHPANLTHPAPDLPAFCRLHLLIWHCRHHQLGSLAVS